MEDQMEDTTENIENPLEGDQENPKVDIIEKDIGLVEDLEKGVIGIAIENHHPQDTDQPADIEGITTDPLVDQKQMIID